MWGDVQSSNMAKGAQGAHMGAHDALAAVEAVLLLVQVHGPANAVRCSRMPPQDLCEYLLHLRAPEAASCPLI